jgi:hypothetical protein
MDARRLVPRQLWRGFDSVVLLVSWRMWKEHNSRVFDNVVIAASQATRVVLNEGDEWVATGFMVISQFLVVPRGLSAERLLLVTHLFKM